MTVILRVPVFGKIKLTS